MNVRAMAAQAPMETITLHSAAGALALWLAVLWNQTQTPLFGPICGDAAAFVGHCPLCVPAALLTGVALAGATRLLLLARRG